MDKEFWISRWQDNMIGFHQAEASPALTKYFERLQLARGDSIFVPLCGKSLDLQWLQQQGNKIIGVELSQLAAADFFKEQALPARIVEGGDFVSYRSGDIEILCGDFFDLNTENLAGVKAVVDRASLIALPENLREKYANKMARLLDSGTKILLITLEYPKSEMSGPPFTVSETDIKNLYADSFSINVLEEKDILAEEPNFQQRGLSQLVEKVYLLQKL